MRHQEGRGLELGREGPYEGWGLSLHSQVPLRFQGGQ